MAKLKKYRVSTMERWAQEYTVKAKSKADAIQRIQDGDGDLKEGPMGFVFRDTLNTKTWEVEEV